MIKTVVPAFVFATVIILSASALAPRHNNLDTAGCNLSYGVDNCSN